VAASLITHDSPRQLMIVTPATGGSQAYRADARDASLRWHDG